MNIIAAHQQGLIEKLDEEVEALAGRITEHGQRAVVLHHLYDHSRGMLGWALAEARRELRISAALAALSRRLGKWGWTFVRRAEATRALEQLARALGTASQARTAAAYRAYRVASTVALRDEAERRLPPALLDALDHCNRARRDGAVLPASIVAALNEECERLAEEAVDQASLPAAWAAIGSTGLARAAMRMLGPRALARAAAQDVKRGSARVEKLLRNDPALPAGFRANPAQHFYAIQQLLAERRMSEWRYACDLDSGLVARAA